MANRRIGDGETVDTQVIIGLGDQLRIEEGGSIAVVRTAPAVLLTGADALLRNDGTISLKGTRAAAVSSDVAGDLDLRIHNSGMIEGLGGAIALASASGSTGKAIIFNSGTLDGNQGIAIDLGSLDTDVMRFFNTRTGMIGNGGVGDVIAFGADIETIGFNNYGTIATRDNARASEIGSAVALGDGGSTRFEISNQFNAVIEGGQDGITGNEATWARIKNKSGGEIIGRNGAGIRFDTSADDGDGIVYIVNNGFIAGRYDGFGTGAGVGLRVGYLVDVFNTEDIVGTGESGDGSISIGVHVGGGSIINGYFALISGDTHGILIDDGAGGDAFAATNIRNHNIISSDSGAAIRFVGNFDDSIYTTDQVIGGGGIAIETGAGNDTVRNSGTVIGAIDLGDGNDRYIGLDDPFRSSTVDGTIFGGAGDDIIIGFTGTERIDGGAGLDLLTGGGGNDVFLFGEGDTTAGPQGADRITDFSPGDTIDLSAIDADANTPGDQAFTLIGTAGFSDAAGELRIRSNGANTFITADTDGDAQADLTIVLKGDVDPADISFVL